MDGMQKGEQIYRDKEIKKMKQRIEELEYAIYHSSPISGSICRYCLSELNKKLEGHKEECVFLSCKERMKK